METSTFPAESEKAKQGMAPSYHCPAARQDQTGSISCALEAWSDGQIFNSTLAEAFYLPGPAGLDGLLTLSHSSRKSAIRWGLPVTARPIQSVSHLSDAVQTLLRDSETPQNRFTHAAILPVRDRVSPTRSTESIPRISGLCSQVSTPSTP